MFPTNDIRILELYRKAIAVDDTEKAKGEEQHRKEYEQKVRDVTSFARRSVCMHNEKDACNDPPECSYKINVPLTKGNRCSKEYKLASIDLFNKLMDDMRTEGLLKLGRQLKLHIEWSGCSPWNGSCPLVWTDPEYYEKRHIDK